MIKNNIFKEKSKCKSTEKNISLGKIEKNNKNLILKKITNSLLILGASYFCYSQFFQPAEASSTSISCAGSLDKTSCNLFTYKKIMEEKIFPQRGFACRVFGWDCYDEMIRKNKTLTEIMNLWWTKGKYADFSSYLKAFNPNAFFNYFCANVKEDRQYPYPKKVLPDSCPSSLRLCYPELAKTCPPRII